MKKILVIIILFLFNAVTYAQFTIKGKITNYKNKRIIIKSYNNFNDSVIGTLKTNNNGEFSQKVAFNYTGIIQFSLVDQRKSINLYFNNQNLNFAVNLDGDYLDFSDYGNEENKYLVEAVNHLNNGGNIDPSKYSQYSKYPFLKYYISTYQLYNNSSVQKTLPQEYIAHFANAGDAFKTSGLELVILINYFRDFLDAKDMKTLENNVRKGIDQLLEEIGEETERGQLTLAALIKICKMYNLNSLVNEYAQKVNDMTCEVSPELKNAFVTHVEIGKAITDIMIKVDEKPTKLYDIKADKKLIFIWASWCPHCREELPKVMQLYEAFKKKGGEIIALSIDTNKDDWERVIKDTKWINYSELLGANSSFVVPLDVLSTPSFILLDKKNKVIKKTSKLNEIIPLL